MKTQLDKLLDFLYCYSHEIRKPLSVVLVISEVLKSEGLSATNEQEYLEGLNMAAKRVKNACEELLMLAFSFQANRSLGTDKIFLESIFKEVEHKLNDDYWLNCGRRVYKFKISADESFLINADQGLLKLAFIWLFCEVFSFESYKENECSFDIHIHNKSDTVQITISNLTDDEDHQKINLEDKNKFFLAFAIETILNESGTIETKLNKHGKPFIIITFPRI